MFSEARKIHLIEEVIKIKSESVLLEMERVLNNYKALEKKQSIYDFVGIISKKDAVDMNQAIADSCESIDENDWK